MKKFLRDLSASLSPDLKAKFKILKFPINKLILFRSLLFIPGLTLFLISMSVLFRLQSIQDAVVELAALIGLFMTLIAFLLTGLKQTLTKFISEASKGGFIIQIAAVTQPQVQQQSGLTNDSDLSKATLH